MSLSALFISIFLASGNMYLPDSVQVQIDTLVIEKDKSIRVSFTNAEGIDSIKWPIDYSKFSVSLNFYEESGLLTEQNLEGKKVIAWEYELSPNFYGKMLFPNAQVWSKGNEHTHSFVDSIEVVMAKKPSLIEEIFGPKNSYKEPNISVNFECDPAKVCTKAWFQDTSFNQGDTVMLVVAINKARALIKIPEVKGLNYQTHWTTSSFTTVDGQVKEYKYMACRFIIDKDLKRIKTKTLKAKYGSSTYYIPKVKLKKNKG